MCSLTYWQARWIGLKVVSYDKFWLNGEAQRFFSEFCWPPVLWDPSKVFERPLVFELPIRKPIDNCKMVFIPLWQWNIKKLRSFVNQCAMASACKTVFAQFTKARGIHRSIYKWKMMDDNQKKVYSAIGNWYRIFSLYILHSLYVVKSKA